MWYPVCMTIYKNKLQSMRDLQRRLSPPDLMSPNWLRIRRGFMSRTLKCHSLKSISEKTYESDDPRRIIAKLQEQYVLDEKMEKIFSKLCSQLECIDDKHERFRITGYVSTLLLPNQIATNDKKIINEADNIIERLELDRKEKVHVDSPIGIHCPDQDELTEYLNKNIEDWNMNIFKVDRLSGGRPLVCVVYYILNKLELFDYLEIERREVLSYLSLVEQNYLTTNTYHNSLHGADVAFSLYHMLQTHRLSALITQLEMFIIIIAGAVHDLGHLGVTNQFLISTSHPLAITYNDISVLENYHCSSAFVIMNVNGCNCFQSFSASNRSYARRLLINAIMHTDLAKHTTVLNNLEYTVKHCFGSEIVLSQGMKENFLSCLVACADISSPTKSLEIYREWTRRVMLEFFEQGDRELELGLTVSPMCDRSNVVVEEAQTTFIDVLVEPVWLNLCTILSPDFNLHMKKLVENRDWFAQQRSRRISIRNRNIAKTSIIQKAKEE